MMSEAGDDLQGAIFSYICRLRPYAAPSSDPGSLAWKPREPEREDVILREACWKLLNYFRLPSNRGRLGPFGLSTLKNSWNETIPARHHNMTFHAWSSARSRFVDIDLSLSLSLQDFKAKLWSLSIKGTAIDMNLVVMIFLSLLMLLCKLAV